VFSFRFAEAGLSTQKHEALNYLVSVEASDEYTAVFYFKSPYYLGGSLGVRSFWPIPQHIMQGPAERYLESKNPDEVLNHRYWTSEYIHLGAFRLTNFDPAEGTDYRAYEGYFLGRPKADVIKVRTFSDLNALFANLLSGTVDLLMDTALNTELGDQLKTRWDESKDGTVIVRPGGSYMLAMQWRPQFQAEPGNFDPRVRAALYQAVDRENLSRLDLPAWHLIPPGYDLHEATRDGFRPFAYDPDRAKARLLDAGWIAGPDGAIRSAAEGRRMHQVVSATPGRDWEIAAYADYWRRIGIETEEVNVPAAQVRNDELRAQFRGWEATSSGAGDSVLGRITGPAATAENRWSGERGGYEDPRAQQLLGRYRTSTSQSEHLQSMRALNDFIVTELPILIFYYKTDHVATRKGFKAFDDVAGGLQAGQPFGTYSRNAYLWDVE
jgi:ABC-type transport system substrate-binding protein